MGMERTTKLIKIKYLDILDRQHSKEFSGDMHSWVASLTIEQVSSVAFALQLFRNGVSPTPYTLLHVAFSGPEGELVLTLDQESRQREIVSASGAGSSHAAASLRTVV